MQPRVLIVTSEAVPLAKTGGLADVIGALAAELRQAGAITSLLMPGYPAAVAGAQRLRRLAHWEDMPGGPVQLLQGSMPDTGVPVLLADSPCFRHRSGNPYVDQDGNEHADNPQGFAALCHAAARICAGQAHMPPPHAVHCNDWHAGLVPLLLKQAGVAGVGSAFTIHNLAFQGNYGMELAPAMGIDLQAAGAEGIEFWGRLSFMKAAIVHAGRVSTVSRNYAQEILTPRFGHGMDGVLRTRAHDLVAIPNGVDRATWNPARDPLIARRYDAADLSGKAYCKSALQKAFGLAPERFAPLMAMGSRLTHQKMADVVVQALPALLDKYPRLQFAAIGCGEARHEQALREIAAAHPGRVGVRIGYDEEAAHALHAGADMLLHPSRFEPFGLTPIYAMLYGTLPIGSRVGGLADTIVDAGPKKPPPDDATGFLFDGDSAGALQEAVDRAIAVFSSPEQWRAMQRSGMAGDFGWDRPVRQYLRMFAEVSDRQGRDAFESLLRVQLGGRESAAAAAGAARAA